MRILSWRLIQFLICNLVEIYIKILFYMHKNMPNVVALMSAAWTLFSSCIYILFRYSRDVFFTILSTSALAPCQFKGILMITFWKMYTSRRFQYHKHCHCNSPWCLSSLTAFYQPFHVIFNVTLVNRNARALRYQSSICIFHTAIRIYFRFSHKIDQIQWTVNATVILTEVL